MASPACPGKFGNYNNADPLLMLEFIRQKLKLDYNGLRALLREKVLQPLGMDGIVISTDPNGLPLITGYIYGPARAWGNLGVLYANDGRLGDAQFLAPGFVDFAATPAPHYPYQAYGGMIWLNRAGFYSFPKEALVMSGAGDQVVVVLRKEKVVIVRIGHRGKSESTFRTMDDSLKRIADVLRAN